MTDQFEQLKRLIEHRNGMYVENVRSDDVLIREGEKKCLERKLASLQSRESELVNSTVNAQILGQRTYDDETKIEYVLHLQQSIKQRRNFYIEESIQHRQATFHRNELVDDVELKVQYHEEEVPPNREWMRSVEESEERWSYDRREAVRYAERWWNDYNPAYRKFEDNCTNYISQCLKAGGAPMVGHPNRSNGWWYRNNNWSYSWSVAHSLRWHLSGAKAGIRGKEMSSASELSPGDVICYDFNGNGRWQHTTIVVAKDENGEPLVNAQTTNSRMRYWKYEDSTAWTPNIKYKYFKITGS